MREARHIREKNARRKKWAGGKTRKRKEKDEPARIRDGKREKDEIEGTRNGLNAKRRRTIHWA